MYGYFGLEKGILWCFEVEFDKLDNIEEVCNVLIGRYCIGWLKLVEYGLIEICEVKMEVEKFINIDKGIVFLYVVSNLCFYD